MSSTNIQTPDSPERVKKPPVHAFQDPQTRILWVLDAQSQLGQQYAALQDKASKEAFMMQHGRNTGTVPPPDPDHQPKGAAHIPEETRRMIAGMKADGLMPGVDKHGNVVGKEEARRNWVEAEEALQRAEGKEEGDIGQ